MTYPAYVLNTLALFIFVACYVSALDEGLGITKVSRTSVNRDGSHQRTLSNNVNQRNSIASKSLNDAEARALDMINLIYQRFEFLLPRHLKTWTRSSFAELRYLIMCADDCRHG